MPKQEIPLNGLQQYLPEGALPLVEHYLRKYHIHLTITRERKRVYGDYRPPVKHANHRISVNGNLNKYHFFITLVHEIAHLVIFEKYATRVAPHGQEWKQQFALLLQDCMNLNLFPDPLKEALLQHTRQTMSSTCYDAHLLKALRVYDTGYKPDGLVWVEEVPDSVPFKTRDGRTFMKIEKLRKRYKCKELSTGHLYVFPPGVEVWPQG